LKRQRAAEESVKELGMRDWRRLIDADLFFQNLEGLMDKEAINAGDPEDPTRKSRRLFRRVHICRQD
jgi:hypothetical protein